MPIKTYISGHRNPDVDSVMSACALADLRRWTGLENVEAICAGRMPALTKWVFDHFLVTDPVRGNSELMFAGDEAVRRALPYCKGKAGVLLMPGVLSRKKQLLPEILAALA